MKSFATGDFFLYAIAPHFLLSHIDRNIDSGRVSNTDRKVRSPVFRRL
ncbi:MAG: hypothetical protein KME17_25460 [Cyanosarcina radialis HA8281-LM2]|nr:hypothetical protein [Cyanosarcina radialis HA8281-LM2]